MRDDVQFVIEMFPARDGDAFLVRIVANGRPTNILVDAGPYATYREVIRPRLAELAADGENLRAFIVTHIDADHIGGAIAFLEDNGASADPSVIEVREVWHNSYRHLFLGGNSPTPEQVARVQRQVVVRAIADTGDISVRQGSTLAALLHRHAYSWNAAFDGGAAATIAGPRRIALDDAISLTLLSPRPVELAALTRMWRRELISVGVSADLVDADAFEAAFERMIERESDIDEADLDDDIQISARALTEPPPPSDFHEDASQPNASSIAFILEVADKRALFLGDARPSTIVPHLRQISATPLGLAAVKVSHHGSRNNTSPDICSTFRVAHALISTDGSKHGHPNIEALLWLVSSQPGVTIHFNYPNPTAQFISAPEMIQRYGHRVIIAPSNSAYTLTL